MADVEPKTGRDHVAAQEPGLRADGVHDRQLVLGLVGAGCLKPPVFTLAIWPATTD
jgi:hypothetical protein